MTKREQMKAAYGLYRQVWRRHIKRQSSDFDARMIAREVLMFDFDDTIIAACQCQFEDRRHPINYYDCFVPIMHVYRCTHSAR